MRTLSIKDIILFRKKADKNKKKFAIEINVEKEKKETEGGGHYWISSLSAISNSFKSNDLQLIADKISTLEEKMEGTDYKGTKIMYKRNIDILYPCWRTRPRVCRKKIKRSDRCQRSLRFNIMISFKLKAGYEP